MKCAKCGYELTEGAKFCSKCGASVEGLAEGDREVSFSVEKIGFHIIKASRLLKQEFGWSFEDVFNGGYSEHIPLSRALELKKKFEEVGMTVSIAEIATNTTHK